MGGGEGQTDNEHTTACNSSEESEKYLKENFASLDLPIHQSDIRALTDKALWLHCKQFCNWGSLTYRFWVTAKLSWYIQTQIVFKLTI